jgi:hypothetical protein
MSYTARLYIDGHQKQKEGLRVLTCDFSFSQGTDASGLPSSNVQGGFINLSIIIENDPEILWWMISDADKNGKIVFMGDDKSNPIKTLEFKDGRLVGYHESFSEVSEVTVTLTISAREISVSGVKYVNSWVNYK